MEMRIRDVGVFVLWVIVACDPPERIDTFSAALANSPVNRGMELVEASVWEPDVDFEEIGHLSALPPEAITKIVGQNVVEARITQYASDPAPRFETRVLKVSADAVTIPADEHRAMRAMREEQLRDSADTPSTPTDDLTERVKDHAGRELLYVRFYPTIDPDASARVDWSSLEARNDPRAALMAAEQERQSELEAASIEIRRLTSDETGCEWVARSRSANAAYLWCPAHESPSQLPDVQEVAAVHTVIASLRGDDFRASTGMQHGHVINGPTNPTDHLC